MKTRMLKSNPARDSQNELLKQIVQLFPKRERRRLVAVTALQSLFGILDLVGVVLVGVIGSITIRGVSNNVPGDRVTRLLTILHLENQQMQTQVLVLGLIAAIFLVSKTFLSIFFGRKVLFYVSRRSAILSKELVGKLFSKSLIIVNQESVQNRVYAVTDGVGLITLGVIANFISVIADGFLLVLIAAGLLLVDPLVASTSLICFLSLGAVLNKTMKFRASALGVSSAKLSIESADRIREIMTSYREILVSNRREYFVKMIGEQRLLLADTKAELAFLPNVSKYVIELSVVLIALLISAIQFLVQDAAHAIAVLSIFLAASTRIAPAILRIQQCSFMIKSSLGASEPTLKLICELQDTVIPKEKLSEFSTDHPRFIPKVELKNVGFKYPEQEEFAISGVTTRIEPGQVAAIVGKSGAGKTTLADLILGVIEPTNGSIIISGQSPKEVVANWPGAIAYVPQEVNISNGTIRGNLSLGFDPDEIPASELNRALTQAQLTDFVDSLPLGANTEVGDRGTKLSGGQRQRLGIARALLTNPKLLVLDEATSSLDGQTELDISDAILNLRGDRTLIVIAHRLSTIRSADIVIYLENGVIIKAGTFEEVRRAVPDFDRQAQLMGL